MAIYIRKRIPVKRHSRKTETDKIIKVTDYTHASKPERRKFIQEGLAFHMKRAKSKDEKELRRFVVEAKINLQKPTTFLWLKQNLIPLGSRMQQWQLYTYESAPKEIITEYEGFWKHVVQKYQVAVKNVNKSIVDILGGKLGEKRHIWAVKPGTGILARKSMTSYDAGCKYTMVKDDSCGDDEFYLEHAQTKKKYKVKAGKHDILQDLPPTEISKAIRIGHPRKYKSGKKVYIKKHILRKRKTPRKDKIELNNNKIVNLYEDGETAQQIANKFGVSEKTISRRLKEEKVLLRSGRFSLLEHLDNQKIKRLYLEKKLSTSEIGKKYNVSPVTILRRLKSIGVELRNFDEGSKIVLAKMKKEKDKIFNENILKKLFHDENKTMSEIAEYFGVGADYISKKLREYGLQRDRQLTGKVPRNAKDNILKMYKEWRTTKEIAQIYGITEGAMSNRLRKWGIRTRTLGSKGRHKPWLENQKLVEMYGENISVPEIAVKFGVSKNTIRTRLLKEGIKLRGKTAKPRKHISPYAGDITVKGSLELKYSKILDQLCEQGIFKTWSYETDKVRWVDSSGMNRRYTPDFVVILNDDSKVYHETKGYLWKDCMKRIAKARQFVPVIVITYELIGLYEQLITNQELNKSWSSKLAEKHPGARWITVLDSHSKMCGRHILIAPHADGTASIVWSPDPTNKQLQEDKAALVVTRDMMLSSVRLNESLLKNG